MSGLLNIGITGIRAAQIGLMTTENNIANANTPGFSRQRSIQTTNIALATGAGFVGQGTSVSTVERMYSRFLVGEVNRAQASVSELESYYDQIKQVDDMLADANAGLSPALQDFFRGVQQVASNPALLPARQSLISSAETMTARFRAIESRLGELYEGVNSQITSTVSTINSYAAQIAELNQRIVISTASTGQPPNDLLDQRDQVIADLNKLIRVTPVMENDGAYNIFIGTGQQLVVGTTVKEMTATAAVADISRIVVGNKTAAGALELPESVITGGSLAGLLRFRSESLDKAANELGRVATSLALTFNAQHGLGQDLLGNVAGDAAFVGDFFTLSQPKVATNALNTGSGSVSASFITPPPHNGTNFYTNLTGHDYRVTFVTATTFTVTDLSNNVEVVPATAVPAVGLQFDGLTIDVAGAPAAGDTFLLQPTREVARNLQIEPRISSDPRLVAVAAPLRTQTTTTNTGNARISAGSVEIGYTLANLMPNGLTLNYQGGNLSNFPTGNVDVTINGTTTTYAITGPTDTVPYTAGATVRFDGMSFTFTGTPRDNDSFRIEKNVGGVADSRNALLLGELQTKNTTAGGTATLQATYARMVSDNGNKTREIIVTKEAQTVMLNQAKSSREALSGVNLDEEAANLLRYQQAYQAASKMFEVAGRLLDTILAIRS